MLHVLIGADDYSVRQALGEIKKGLGDATALMTNTTVLDGRQVTVAQLRAAAETVPFLGDKRLVVVEGLLERFEPPEKNGRKRAPRPSARPEELQTIAGAMRHLPPFTEVVILGGDIKNGNPLLQELSALTGIKSFPLLKGPPLSQWIERRVAAAGAKISPQAVDLMVRFVGSDLWTMAGEVDKLAQYAGGRRIEAADVQAVVSCAQEASVFAMVDAILEARVGAAQGLLQQLFRQGAAPAQLLVMLARQARTILLVKEMRDSGRTRPEIRTRLGLTSDFLLRKAWEQADRYTMPGLRGVFHKLLEADMAIKTGKLDGEIALDILVAELGQRGPVPTR